MIKQPEMIMVCRQTAIQGHELDEDYSALAYCSSCPDKDTDCDISPFWITKEEKHE